MTILDIRQFKDGPQKCCILIKKYVYTVSWK